MIMRSVLAACTYKPLVIIYNTDRANLNDDDDEEDKAAVAAQDYLQYFSIPPFCGRQEMAHTR